MRRQKLTDSSDLPTGGSTANSKSRVEAVDAEIQRLKLDPEFQDVVRESSEWDFDIIAAFRDGARRPCIKHIWALISGAWGTGSPRQLACEGLLTRGETHRIKSQHIMSTDVLFALVSELEWRLGQLDPDDNPLPSVEVRAIHGYRLAVACIAGDCLKDRASADDTLITEEDVLFSLQLVASELFQNLHRLRRREKKPLSNADWQNLWEDVAPAVTAFMNVSFPVALQCNNGTKLKRLFERIGTPVANCRASIPFRWLND